MDYTINIDNPDVRKIFEGHLEEDSRSFAGVDGEVFHVPASKWVSIDHMHSNHYMLWYKDRREIPANEEEELPATIEEFTNNREFVLGE